MVYSTPSRKRARKFKAPGGSTIRKRRKKGGDLIARLPRSSAPLVPNIAILKRTQVVELVYSEPIATQLVGTGCTFRLTNLYDPNAAAGGHQPRGFDQLAVLYGKYRVISAAFAVVFVPTIATTASKMGCTTYCTVHIPGNSPSSQLDFAEAKSTVVSHMGGWLATATTSTDGKLMNVCKGSVNIKEFLGPVDDDNLEATFLGGPTNNVEISMQSFGNNAGEITQVGNYHVTIRYKVLVFDPKQPGSS